MTNRPDARSMIRLSSRCFALEVDKRALVVTMACGLVVAMLTILALGTGSYALTSKQVLKALTYGTTDDRLLAIVWEARLPRSVAAVLVGLALGAAGCIFQSISRNALGSPDIIGFTTGAATGAIIHIIFINAGALGTALASLIGGLATAALVYVLSLHGGITGGYRLVLIGIGVSAMLTALNTLMLARGHIDLAVKARMWLMGSLSQATWSTIGPASVATFVALGLICACARALTIMEMGDDEAQQLGVRVEHIRRLSTLGGVALTACAVAMAGPISFVALAAAQIVRRLTASARVHVVSSAVMGAALLCGADLTAKSIPGPVAVPVGILTGLIGGLYFIALIARQRSV